jgi:hypothetical protein
MTDIVERLRSSEPLPACPFDRISPHYLTMPADKPCPFCGQENTPDGPDKCRGADTRIMGEAANEIEDLRLTVSGLNKDWNALRAVLVQFVAACDTAPPTSLMAELGIACTAAKAALALSSGERDSK